MTAAGTEIVLTGFGLLTAYGRGVGAFWDGLLSGRSALGAGERFSTAGYQDEPVGEVPFDGPAALTRKQALLEAAVGEALHSAGLAELPDGCLLVLVGQAPEVGAAAPAEAAELAGPPLRVARGGALFGGAPFYLSHACASGAFGVALAREALLSGAVRTAVVAGASALNPLEYASMQAVRAVGAAGARPFDRARAGITVGEGAGAVVLEHRRTARERGRAADVLLGSAVVRVAGSKSAASDEDVIADCVRAACAESGADRVDYVHAHATGTEQGDAAELRALETLAAELDQRGLPVSSHKGAVGHLLHASCFPALAAAALALRHATVPPTPGLTTPEPVDRLTLPTTPAPLSTPHHALLTSFGFGGNNAALTLHHPS